MFFPPTPTESVYIVFQLSHSHLEIAVTAQNIDTIGRTIKESNEAGMGRICVPLSEIKYFLQKTKNTMILVFKDGEKLEVICTMDEILKVVGEKRNARFAWDSKFGDEDNKTEDQESKA